MGASTKTWCYVATVVLCLLLTSAPSRARKVLSQDPLLDELCSDLRDDDEVRVYARPVDEVGEEEGTAVDVCKAMGWFVKFLQPKIDIKGPTEVSASTNVKNKKRKQNESVDAKADDNSLVDCSDPDIQRASLSNLIPGSKNVCDVSQAFPKPVLDGPTARGLVCWPPPYFCISTTSGRRLMQSTKESREVKVSIDCKASTESSGSIRKSDGADEIDESDTTNGCDQSSVSVVVNGSEVSEETKPEEPGPPKAPTRGAAVTVCKGQCCVTTVVTGVMYKRIFDTVSSNSCPGFPKPSPSTPTKIKSTGSTTGSKNSSSSRSGSTSTSSSQSSSGSSSEG